MIIAAMKLRHAQTRDAAPVGIFGNSRVLMLGHDDLGFSNQRFFNFAISSESLSGSVLLANRLASQSLLPANVIVGIDHFYLQRDNVPIWPDFSERLKYNVNLIWHGLHTAGVPLATSAQRLWRALWGEPIRFKMAFDPQLLLHGLTRLLHLPEELPAAEVGKGGYRPDGSRWQGQTPAKDLGVIAPTNSKIDLGKLRQNLAALGKVVQQGHKVYVFETPLHPLTAHKLDVLETPYMKESRRIWHQECTKWRLICIDAPILDSVPAIPWPNETHAPETPWADFIRSILLKTDIYAVQ